VPLPMIEMTQSTKEYGMSTTHDPKEEAHQAASTASGARMILLTVLLIVVVFGLFLGIALYAGVASR
jgi:hypothetical protein